MRVYKTPYGKYCLLDNSNRITYNEAYISFLLQRPSFTSFIANQDWLDSHQYRFYGVYDAGNLIRSMSEIRRKYPEFFV
jgi:hypothetical protein